MSRSEIADAEGLTSPYVFKIAKELIAAGLICSKKGRYGGYDLARPPGEITVADVYRAMEGPVALAPCDEGCERRPECTTTVTWHEISAALETEMGKRTIADMATALNRRQRDPEGL